MRKRKIGVKSGFTLVELLVVISIIALLLAILMPSLQKAREQGRKVVCMTNLKQQAYALLLYTEDNNGKLPTANEFGNAVSKYFSIGKSEAPWTGGSKYMWCPTQKNEYGKYSYGINWVNVFGSEGSWVSSPGLNEAFCQSRKLKNIKNTVFLVADGSTAWIMPPNRFFWDYDTPPGRDGILDSVRFYWLQHPELRYNGFTPRHSNKGNVIIADYSVRGVPLLDWLSNMGLGRSGNGLWGMPERP
jgi:prepilin-type N-terminal cleavage/methylation domain-containing protein